MRRKLPLISLFMLVFMYYRSMDSYALDMAGLYPDYTQEEIEEVPVVTAKNEKFLIYFSHGGITNQLLGLKSASELAFGVGRTLVLPPVLPHFDPNVNSSVGFLGRNGFPAECKDMKDGTLDYVKKDALLAAKLNPSVFPSYNEIINITQLSNVTGVKYIDLPDFMDRMKHSIDGFVPDKSEDSIFQCPTPHHPYEWYIDKFQKSYGNATVAVIGSAFFLFIEFPKLNSTEKPYARPFFDEGDFRSILPSDRFLKAVKKALNVLGDANYVGIHMRFKDAKDGSINCTDRDIRNAYTNVRNNLRRQRVKQNATIFLGSSNRKVQQCYLENNHVQNGYTKVRTLHDLLEQDKQLKQMLTEEFVLDDTTLFVLLDQILISLANKIVLDQSSFQKFYNFESSFQIMIMYRHTKRQHILNSLKGVESDGDA